MAIIYHEGFEQNTPQWDKVRCGKLTCSALSKIITPAKLQISSQAKDHALVIAAERIRGKAEESPTSFDMERGNMLESEARYIYSENFGEVEQLAFMEDDAIPFKFGGSPDGLIDGRKGGIEIKCPQAKGHLSTFLDGNIIGSYVLQMQGLMACGNLEYMDFVSFCEGLKMSPIRIHRDEAIIQKILKAGCDFEEMVLDVISRYESKDGVQIQMPEDIE